MSIEYSSNNSGGRWWLTDQHWRDLEAAGWKVDWYTSNPSGIRRLDANGRWLGALASNATRSGLSLGAAIDEWERITGMDSTDEGCQCCGRPHNFYSWPEPPHD